MSASKLHVSADFLGGVRYLLTQWQSYAPLTARERAIAAQAYQSTEGNNHSAAYEIFAARRARLLGAKGAGA